MNQDINNTIGEEEEIKKILVDDPLNHPLRINLIISYIRRSKINEAITQFTVLKSLSPENSDLEYLHAILEKAQITDESSKNADSGAGDSNGFDTLETNETNKFTSHSTYQSQPQDVLLEDNIPVFGFDDVGGLENLKKDVDIKFIKALENPELFAQFGKQAGGSLLLFGPPGCGKTYFAKAVAGQIKGQFISVGISEILDMYIGESEKNVSRIFEQARFRKPSVIFFDEIDVLGNQRSTGSKTNSVVNQFLLELDSIGKSNQGVMVIGATNMPWSIDSALKRPGRFDLIRFVSPPEKSVRKGIFELHLRNKPVENIDYELLAEKSHLYSGADIAHVINLAGEETIEEILNGKQDSKITTAKILKYINSHKPTTLEWFSNIKNFTQFQNQGGYYDEVIAYMKTNGLS